VDVQSKHLLIRLCYATLIHLGDLSRYQETELSHKERNWGPAKGYYDLAKALDPADGQSWNQLAVISLEDNNYLRAIYHLYRSLSTTKPPPATSTNLEVTYKKILKQQKRGEDLTQGQSPHLAHLAATCLAYHAKCHSDIEFDDPEEQELRRAFIDVFRTSLPTGQVDSTYRKICLINFAAAKHAEMHVPKAFKADSDKADRYSQRLRALNIGCFTMLFELLEEEMQNYVDDAGTVSPLGRKLLPLLRLYSAWLLSNLDCLLEPLSIGHPEQHIHRAWTAYTAALTRLIARFDVTQLPQAPYLLDEDQQVKVFTPFSDLARSLHLETSPGTLKPTRTEFTSSEPFRPEQEMFARIRALVHVGAYLDRNRVIVPNSYS
jgi:hypothetical protein